MSGLHRRVIGGHRARLLVPMAWRPKPQVTHRREQARGAAGHAGAAVRVAMVTPVAALAVASGVTTRVEAAREPAEPSGHIATVPTAPVAAARAALPPPADIDDRAVTPVVRWRRNVVVPTTTSEIPALARLAYTRAQLVMERAKSSCRLDWTLVAAVGYVESNHGHHAGSRLDGRGWPIQPFEAPGLTAARVRLW
jgi:hypothetical protein